MSGSGHLHSSVQIFRLLIGWLGTVRLEPTGGNQMKRMIWGIVLVVTGLASLSGQLTTRGQVVNYGALVLAAIMAAGGGVMIAFGAEAERQKVRIMDAAFAAWRRVGSIQTAAVAAESGASIVTVRQLLIREQGMGVLPREIPMDEPPAAPTVVRGAA